MESRPPHRPTNIPEYAEACLRAIAAKGLGDLVSLGGGLGLLHYLDYRSTHDVDAWWSPNARGDQRRELVAVVAETLARFGPVRTRTWGEVVSIELKREGRTVFSFQIADRSAQLEANVPSPLGGVWLDSFADIVASKMVALVERGAPRDFRDIFAVCQAGLVSPRECWGLWSRRQAAAGSDADAGRARLAVETHLARISQHRRIEQIADPDERSSAERVRGWFTQEFLDALG